MYPLTDVEYRYESEATAIRIEKLRAILETEQNRPISYEEAEKIAEKILNFFLTLANHSPIVEAQTFQPNLVETPSKFALNQLALVPAEGV